MSPINTPDRVEGVRFEEEIQLEANTSPVGGPGSISFDGTTFSLIDDTGSYDPRSLLDIDHKAVRHLIHFISDGPAEGFASGAYKETTPSTPFPTSEIWWESASKLKKIVELTTTWSGVKVTQEVWKIYDTDGSTVLATITDSYTYTGIFEASRTRTIA